METIKCLLALICCVPLMLALFWLFGTAIDFLCELADEAGDSVLYRILVMPIVGILAVLVVPSLFVAAVTGVWILSAELWGVY